MICGGAVSWPKASPSKTSPKPLKDKHFLSFPSKIVVSGRQPQRQYDQVHKLILPPNILAHISGCRDSNSSSGIRTTFICRRPPRASDTSAILGERIKVPFFIHLSHCKHLLLRVICCSLTLAHCYLWLPNFAELGHDSSEK